jgi:hypothetical protein
VRKCSKSINVILKLIRFLMSKCVLNVVNSCMLGEQDNIPNCEDGSYY